MYAKGRAPFRHTPAMYLYSVWAARCLVLLSTLRAQRDGNTTRGTRNARGPTLRACARCSAPPLPAMATSRYHLASPRSARTWTPAAGTLDAEVPRAPSFADPRAPRCPRSGRSRVIRHARPARSIRREGPGAAQRATPPACRARSACEARSGFVPIRARAWWGEAARLRGSSTWWRACGRCRVAPIVSVDTLLASVFRPGWCHWSLGGVQVDGSRGVSIGSSGRRCAGLL